MSWPEKSYRPIKSVRGSSLVLTIEQKLSTLFSCFFHRSYKRDLLAILEWTFGLFLHIELHSIQILHSSPHYLSKVSYKFVIVSFTAVFNPTLTHLHCKKRLMICPSPDGMSLTKLSLAGIFKFFPARESLSLEAFIRLIVYST